jgi:thiamine transport system ATP-binding protein
VADEHDVDRPLLDVAGLRVAYGTTEVLRGVDLAVPDASLVCVLGPSGSGKTTLLRAIAGLEAPTAGTIELDGRDLTGVPSHLRGVGLMFQDYALFPHQDVAGNVAFGLRMAGESHAAIQARVREVLALVGLSGTEKRRVDQLSGGEQQRVALARALAPRPRLLMLDEPMGSLDRTLRERLPEELRALFRSLGLAALYVTHDQDEALSVADRVLILERGRVVADDTPEALWSRPPSAWVARFLGSRNVADATIEADGTLATPWGRLAVPQEPGPALAPPESRDRTVSVVLRPASLRPDPAGPIRGTVATRRFGGDHVLLGVAVGDAPVLHVEARWAELPAIGDPIGLGVEAAGLHVIAPDRRVRSHDE